MGPTGVDLIVDDRNKIYNGLYRKKIKFEHRKPAPRNGFKTIPIEKIEQVSDGSASSYGTTPSTSTTALSALSSEPPIEVEDGISSEPDEPGETQSEPEVQLVTLVESSNYQQHSDFTFYTDIVKPYVRPVVFEICGSCSGIDRKLFYHVKVHLTHASQHDDKIPTFSRTFHKFKSLYNHLKLKNSKNSIDLLFPPVVPFGNHFTSVITKRQQDLIVFLNQIYDNHWLRSDPYFEKFLYKSYEWHEVGELITKHNYARAAKLLEHLYSLLSRFYTDRHISIMYTLCALVICYLETKDYEEVIKYIEITALRYQSRFLHVCDVDVLKLYVPFLKVAASFYQSIGKDHTRFSNCVEHYRFSIGMDIGCTPTLLSVLEHHFRSKGS